MLIEWLRNSLDDWDTFRLHITVYTLNTIILPWLRKYREINLTTYLLLLVEDLRFSERWLLRVYLLGYNAA
jgi:hypothetical protein